MSLKSITSGRHQASAMISDDCCDTDRCIHWLFEENVRSAPKAVAVDDGRSLLSYDELNNRANQLAHHLRSKGIGRGSQVGVCMERGADVVAALVGILKCGAAYVPMEPAWPDQRIDLIAELLNLRALVIDPALGSRSIKLLRQAPGEVEIAFVQDGRVGEIDDRASGDTSASIHWRLGLPTEDPVRLETPDDRAYIIFTSGSSGQPKAVVVRHRPVINLIDWVNKRFRVGRADKLLLATSIAFDLSVYDIFGMLAAGGVIRVATATELRDPQRTAEILLHEGITFWDSAPAAFERLCPFLKSVDGGSKLRLVFLSGDWIPLSLPSVIKQRFPHAKVVALGGATEATVWSNFHEIGEIDPAWQSIPYGRPIQNARYYILDSDLNPCPLGTAGELYIGGACLADGYANDPDLTARKFIPDPFLPGQRLYRTGDRARHFPDGNIEFLGRVDRQMKIRGFRVEPAEIESALQQHPIVRRAIVVAEGEALAAKRLVAYIVVDDVKVRAAISSALTSYLRLRLPQYMVPSRIVVLPQLPLTINGKIDISALASTRQIAAEESEAPCTERQRTLAALWRRVLGVEKVGIHENFFDLGGDSLQTVEMIAGAARLGLNIRIQDIFGHPTISQLAALCTAAQRHDAYEADGELPLTPTQSWFFARPLRFPDRYNAVFAFEVAGFLEPESFRSAMRHLQIHHRAMLLRFKCVGGRRVQFHASPDAAADVIAWDLSLLPDDLHRAELAKRVSDLRRGFNLEHDSLVKVILLNRGPCHRQQMLLVLHHLIFDAASLGVILEDLTIAIDQIDRGLPVRLPSSSTFAAWTRRLNAYAASTEVQAESNYWLGLPWNQVKPLPRDFPSGANRYGEAESICAELSVEETCALQREVPRRCGASIGEILLAGCVQMLSHWAERETMLIDLTDHGRHELFNDISLSRTVGYVTSNVPIVIAVPRDASLAEVAAHVRDHLRSMPKWGTGYGILRYLSPENQSVARLRRLSHPEVKFNYLGSMTTDGATTTLFRPVPSVFPGVLDQEDQRAYLHNLELCIIGGKLRVEWKYSAAVHKAHTIRRLMGKYMSTLRELIWDAVPDGDFTNAASTGGRAKWTS